MSQSYSICLIHGHGVDASVWDSIYADLASDTMVLKPDFSRLTNLTTIEAYADELYTFLQAEKVEQVILVGHSMGGYMALAFAEKNPEMVQALILYHSTATADDDTRKEARRQAIEGLKAQGATPFIQKQLPKMVAPDYPSGKTQILINRFQNLPAEALIAGMTAMANRPDRTHILRNAQCPILLVLSRQDQLMPYEKTAQLADLSNNVNVATIEYAGHLSMIEQPDASIQVLGSFMANF